MKKLTALITVAVLALTIVSGASAKTPLERRQAVTIAKQAKIIKQQKAQLRTRARTIAQLRARPPVTVPGPTVFVNVPGPTVTVPGPVSYTGDLNTYVSTATGAQLWDLLGLVAVRFDAIPLYGSSTFTTDGYRTITFDWSTF